MNAAARFVACAMAQIGKRYVWATAGPDTFDCSGLVAYCHQRATGQQITRSSYDQAKLGVEVEPGAPLLPGDVVYWGWGRADHVGIYAGVGQVINALNAQRGVISSELDADYDMPLLGARRIFTEGASTATEPIDTPDNGKPGLSPGPSTVTGKDPALQYGDSNRHERRRGKKLTRRGGRRGRR